MKSHLIPAAFYKPMLGHPDRRLIEVEEAATSRLRQSGVWDRALNCEECERSFSPWDEEGTRLLIRSNWNAIRRNYGDLSHYVVEDYSYHKLKLFFISVLWRICASDRSLGGTLRLGPRLDALRQMVRDARSGDSNEFGVVATRMVPRTQLEFEPTKIIPSPHQERTPDGVHRVRLHFGGFEVLVKTDSRPWHPDVEPYVLKDQSTWCVLEGAYEDGLAHWTAFNQVFRGGRRA